MDEAVWNFHFGYIGDVFAGSNIVNTPVPNARSKLCSVAFRFTTDATVIDRRIILNIHNTVNFSPIAYPVVTQIASQVKDYLYTTGAQNYVNPANDKYVIGISPDIVLLEDWGVQSNIENLQLGDQVTRLVYIWKFWTYEQ